jgi:hypothetical protein
LEELKFNQDDLRLMAGLGISESRVLAQIELFKHSSGFLSLARPCTPSDGIEKIAEDETDDLIQDQEEAARAGRFLKFVPASGAATRMFQAILPFYLYPSSMDPEVLRKERNHDLKSQELLRFISGIREFGFFEDLKACLARDGQDISRALEQGQWALILEYFLTERGLNFLNLPKGLHTFHAYPDQKRTAFEEHLVEAFQTVCDRTGRCRLHITVSPEHEETFREFFENRRTGYEDRYHGRLDIGFSVQSPATNTLAVDFENRPFRDETGALVFRPGGHGALLPNLNNLRGDLVYIKNIDNVLPDRFKGPTIIWKKVLGGLLVKVQGMIHDFVRRLVQGEGGAYLLKRIREYCRGNLLLSEPPDFRQRSRKEQRAFLIELLDRPLRVCGMVKNEGEPGGGPFWVRGRDGSLSRQIVERAQVDPRSAGQQALWASSTHFNPVDLVCGVRDHQGRPFDLRDYTDPEAVFISRKSQHGRELKALECPGLWNGAMAKWITLFVEVPNQTFSPVKTINDLLKPEHLNKP